MKNIFKNNINKITQYTQSLLQSIIHAKQIDSIVNAVIGIAFATSLQVSKIGQSLAAAKGLNVKHAIKQIDRLLSNEKIDDEACNEALINRLIKGRKEMMCAMDWTSFEADGHQTLTINLVTHHGRATTLLWKTVEQSDLKGHQTQIEDELLAKLRKYVSKETKVTILADRGFGTIHRFKQIKKTLKFEYIIRFRGNIHVSDNRGVTRIAKQWLLKGSRSKTLKNAGVTNQCFEVGKVVMVKDKGMKDVWCLACSEDGLSTKLAKRYYGKRWGIETKYKDYKNIRFGMGLSESHIERTDRRDRLFLISAIATVFLTLLGAASEAAGYDKYIKANTVKRRTHSLFLQGCIVYNLLPTMKRKSLKSIMGIFSKLIRKQNRFTEVFSYV